MQSPFKKVTRKDETSTFKPFSINELLKHMASVIKGHEVEYKTDFSKTLAEVTDKRLILKSIVETCEKDIADLKNAVLSNDIKSMQSTAHRMFPMWEMLSMDGILSTYRNILESLTLLEQRTRTTFACGLVNSATMNRSILYGLYHNSKIKFQMKHSSIYEKILILHYYIIYA